MGLTFVVQKCSVKSKIEILIIADDIKRRLPFHMSIIRIIDHIFGKQQNPKGSRLQVPVPWFCSSSPWTTCPPTSGWLQHLYPSCWSTGQRGDSWEEPQVQLKGTAIWPGVEILLKPSSLNQWSSWKVQTAPTTKSIQPCHVWNMFNLNQLNKAKGKQLGCKIF